ncbi:alpha/beta fold hydrolase [candidate division KSB1 bacterium]
MTSKMIDLKDKKALYEEHRSQVKTYDGGELPVEYLLTGKEDGETILFIHGLCMNISYFFPNIIYLTDKYRILAVSLRGHGNSGVPQPENTENYSFAKKSEDIRILADHLGIKKFHCVGSSMGGMVAQEMADRYPDYFLSLTTVGTPPRIGFPKWLTTIVTKHFYKLVGLIGRRLYARGVSRFVGKSDTAQEHLYNILLELNPGGNFHSRVNAAGYNHIEKIRNIKVPYLLIMGTRDKFMNRRMGPMIEIYKANSNIELETIKGAGHCANLDFPVEFNKMLEKFIKQEY